MLLVKQQRNQLMMVIIIIQGPWKKAIAEIQEEQYSLPGKKDPDVPQNKDTFNYTRNVK